MKGWKSDISTANARGKVHGAIKETSMFQSMLHLCPKIALILEVATPSGKSIGDVVHRE